MEIPDALAARLRARTDRRLKALENAGADEQDGVDGGESDDDDEEEGGAGQDGAPDELDEAGNVDWALVVQRMGLSAATTASGSNAQQLSLEQTNGVGAEGSGAGSEPGDALAAKGARRRPLRPRVAAVKHPRTSWAPLVWLNLQFAVPFILTIAFYATVYVTTVAVAAKSDLLVDAREGCGSDLPGFDSEISTHSTPLSTEITSTMVAQVRLSVDFKALYCPLCASALLADRRPRPDLCAPHHHAGEHSAQYFISALARSLSSLAPADGPGGGDRTPRRPVRGHRQPGRVLDPPLRLRRDVGPVPAVVWCDRVRKWLRSGGRGCFPGGCLYRRLPLCRRQRVRRLHAHPAVHERGVLRRIKRDCRSRFRRNDCGAGDDPVGRHCFFPSASRTFPFLPGACAALCGPRRMCCPRSCGCHRRGHGDRPEQRGRNVLDIHGTQCAGDDQHG